MEDEEQNARDARDDTYEFIQKMSYQYDPLLIAANMIIQGLGIYKKVLEPNEYESLCEKIYTDRNQINKLP